MKTRWRLPVAVTTSVILGLFVYCIAERTRQPQSATPPLHVAALDTESLVALCDLVRTLTPPDDTFVLSNSGGRALLTALQLSGFMHVNTPLEPSQGDLSEAELDAIGSVIGRPADA